MGRFTHLLLATLGLMAAPAVLADCNYQASNVVTGTNSLTADLKLTGSCSQYPDDHQGALVDLKLLVEYQTSDRLHVMVYDGGLNMYQIQESFFPRPGKENPTDNKLKFNVVNNPFSFSVVRVSNGDVLFDTSGSAMVFQSQLLRLRTKLPSNPNLYGLGENSDSFRLQTTAYTRTMWNSESPFLPRKSNLYGSHPMYLEHRGSKGTHGVFLLNANGMDIKIDVDSSGQQFLEYNVIGGVFDFYFFAGSSPVEVSQQYAVATGTAAMVPYWAFGFHQCKYGWANLQTVKDVVANYSQVGIPLEVMWGDIDYMEGRQDFTTSASNYPFADYQRFINSLHSNGQKYVMMVDPGIHYVNNYGPYARGHAQNVFLKADDGSEYRGKQWAGQVVWPDWFASNTQSWWTNEIMSFFDPANGLNIDGMWNDMNEASNFCGDINCNPATKKRAELPAPPTLQHSARFRPAATADLAARQFSGQQKKGLPYRNLFSPNYKIQNHRGDLSDYTLYTNISNADGSVQYDTHNLYGTMMGGASRNALLTRKPGKRPFVLTRSTFAGAGNKLAHWFGDNYSAWDDYRFSIGQMLTFTAVHNMPMVGSDVCGFNGNAQEKMCARWAMLGAFQPFYRNHADESAPVQEFYRFPLAIPAAKKAIDARYRLLDYMYTASRRSNGAGTPVASPLFFKYPNDANTFPIQYQWFYGDALLISPVYEDDATSVTYYLPNDLFYDFWTLAPVRGAGASVTANNVGWDAIPVHIRGGRILPLRSSSAMTTTALRTKNFSIVIASGLDGSARGELYLDDGETINGAFNDVQMFWDGTTFTVDGVWGYNPGVVVDTITVLTQSGAQKKKTGSWPLTGKISVSF